LFDLLGITVRTVKVDPKTYQVDLKAMERAINKNTIMVIIRLWFNAYSCGLLHDYSHFLHASILIYANCPQFIDHKTKSL
jgi:hypothetical protein